MRMPFLRACFTLIPFRENAAASGVTLEADVLEKIEGILGTKQTP